MEGGHVSVSNRFNKAHDLLFPAGKPQFLHVS